VPSGCLLPLAPALNAAVRYPGVSQLSTFCDIWHACAQEMAHSRHLMKARAPDGQSWERRIIAKGAIEMSMTFTPGENADLVSSPSATAPTDEWDAIVLGAGVAGLVATKLLQDAGYRRILIIDEYKTIGGNHIDCSFGPYTFDVGTILFYDNSSLLSHFPELIDNYRRISYKFSRITPDGSIRDYPLSR
jgi:hypothetical protein